MNQRVGYLSSTKRCFKLIKRTSIILALFSLILSIISSQTVYSVDGIPNCTFSDLITEGDPLQLVIKLNCQNVDSFANSNSNSADSVDILGIELYLTDDIINPEAATIDGDILSLRFEMIEDLTDIDISIGERILLDSSGLLSNALINIFEDNIIDRNPPIAAHDYYSVGAGVVLVISPANGLLFNDMDIEGAVSNSLIVAEPLHGVVVLLTDGSFTYTQDATYVGEDIFSYSISDENGNSSQANVYISTPLPTITGAFYKVGAGSSVKVGDVLRADITASRPVDIFTKTINLIDTTVEQTDATHFSIFRTMSELDVERLVTFSVTVHDEFGRAVTLGTELGFLFDRTKPIIHLNDDAEVYLDIYNPYEDPVTVTDNFDNNLTIVIEGLVNPDVVGDYEIKYYAIDIAGNKSEVLTKLIHVIGPIDNRFNEIKNNPTHEEKPAVIGVDLNNPVVLAANIFVRKSTINNTSTSNTATVTQPIVDEIINVDPINENQQNDRSKFLGFEWYWWLLFAFMTVIIIWTLLGL